MSVPMLASKSFVYAGSRRNPGDAFEARGESDARVLEAVGNARRDLQVPKAITDPEPLAAAPKRGRGYRKQALEAQPATETAPDTSQGAGEAQASEQGTGDTPGTGNAEAPPPGRRRYQRRDLRAEDQ